MANTTSDKQRKKTRYACFIEQAQQLSMMLSIVCYVKKW
jgi:hypothetical protein